MHCRFIDIWYIHWKIWCAFRVGTMPPCQGRWRRSMKSRHPRERAKAGARIEKQIWIFAGSTHRRLIQLNSVCVATLSTSCAYTDCTCFANKQLKSQICQGKGKGKSKEEEPPLRFRIWGPLGFSGSKTSRVLLPVDLIQLIPPCGGDSRVGKVAMGLRTSMNAPM